MRRSNPFRAIGVVLLGACSVASTAAYAQDPIFYGDFVHPTTSEIVELLPNTPWVFPDGSVDATPQAIGDVDIVVRTGLTVFAFGIPLPSLLRTPSVIPVGVAEPAGGGRAIPVVVAASRGVGPSGAGLALVSPDLEGKPVLMVAYADLDGDGFVGITSLDGDPTDHAIEEAELTPVGRRYAFFANGQAPGQLFVGVAGPDESPLRVVVTAVAYVGPTNPALYGGVVPDGPAVMTSVPGLFRTSPQEVLGGGLPGVPDENGTVGAELTDYFTPDPVAGAYGEAFTLWTDGTDPTIDVAEARSGHVSSFGLARFADPATFNLATGGTIRPGLDGAGQRAVLETLNPLDVSTGVGVESFRIVPLDRFGNIATLASPNTASVQAGPGLEIRFPDTDADLTKELIPMTDTRGAQMDLQGTGSLLIEMVIDPGPFAPPLAVPALGPVASGILAGLMLSGGRTLLSRRARLAKSGPVDFN